MDRQSHLWKIGLCCCEFCLAREQAAHWQIDGELLVNAGHSDKVASNHFLPTRMHLQAGYHPF
jgi:hypothetical protein